MVESYVRFRSVTPRQKFDRERIEFWIDRWARKALQEIRDLEGIPESEQLRRAVGAWLESKGVVQKAERRRAATRKRS